MAERIPVGRDEQLEIYTTKHHAKTIVHIHLLTADTLRGYRRAERKGIELDASLVPLVFEQIRKLITTSGAK